VHGQELGHLSGYALRRIVQSDDLLEMASRLCEKETKVGKEAWRRVYETFEKTSGGIPWAVGASPREWAKAQQPASH